MLKYLMVFLFVVLFIANFCLLQAQNIIGSGNYIDLVTQLNSQGNTPKELVTSYSSTDGSLMSSICDDNGEVDLYTQNIDGSYADTNLTALVPSSFTYIKTISIDGQGDALSLFSYTSLDKRNKEVLSKSSLTSSITLYTFMVYDKESNSWKNIGAWPGYNYQTIYNGTSSNTHSTIQKSFESYISVEWVSGNPIIYCIGDVYNDSTSSYIPECVYYAPDQSGQNWAWNEQSINPSASNPFIQDMTNVAYFSVYQWADKLGYNPQAVIANASGGFEYLNTNSWFIGVPVLPSPGLYNANFFEVQGVGTMQPGQDKPEIIVSDGKSIYFFGYGGSSWINLTSSSIQGSNNLPFNSASLTSVCCNWSSAIGVNPDIVCEFSNGSFYYFNGTEWIYLSSENFINGNVSVLWSLFDNLGNNKNPSFVFTNSLNSSAVYYDGINSNTIANIDNISSSTGTNDSHLVNIGFWNPLDVLPSYTVATTNGVNFHHIYEWENICSNTAVDSGVSDISWSNENALENQLRSGYPDYFWSWNGSLGIERHNYNSIESNYDINSYALPAGKTISECFFAPIGIGLDGNCVAVMSDDSIYYFNSATDSWIAYASPVKGFNENILKVFPDWENSSLRGLKNLQNSYLPQLMIECSDNIFYIYQNGVWNQINTFSGYQGNVSGVTNYWNNGIDNCQLDFKNYLFNFDPQNNKFISVYTTSSPRPIPTSKITAYNASIYSIVPFETFSDGTYTSLSSLNLAYYNVGSGQGAFTTISDSNISIPSNFITSATDIGNITATSSSSDFFNCEAIFGSTKGEVIFYNGSTWQQLGSLPPGSTIQEFYTNWNGVVLGGSIPQVLVYYTSDGTNYLAYLNPVNSAWICITPNGCSSINSVDAFWQVSLYSLPYVSVNFSNNTTQLFI